MARLQCQGGERVGEKVSGCGGGATVALQRLYSIVKVRRRHHLCCSVCCQSTACQVEKM